MKLYKVFIFLFLSTTVFSQEKIRHTVVSGESVYSISRKYNVSEEAIFELNPKAKGVLALDMVLYIPKSPKAKKSEKNQPIPKGASHKVVSGESLYTIAKKYDTSMDKLREANPQLESDNLQLGQLLALPKGLKQIEEKPSKAETAKIAKLQKRLLQHTVASGESFYVIARKYNVSVEELKKANPQVDNDKLDVKDVVYIPGTETEVAQTVKASKGEKSKKEPAIEPATQPQIATHAEAQLHEVQPKETKYGISKRYGLTIAELEAQNPQIATGLEIGQQLSIKSKTSVLPKVTPASEDQKDIASSAESLPAENTTVVLPLSADASMKADFLIAKASENLGVRYRGGGTDRNGFDCSGLMFSTFRNIDMTLPRSSSDMAINSGVKIDRSQAQKGDLIFFGTRGRWVGHVGMITEVLDDEIKFIHSSTSSGVIISSTKEDYYAKRFVQINRVLN